MNYQSFVIKIIMLMQLVVIVPQLSHAQSKSLIADQSLQQAILIHINEYRHKRGLSTLTMNEQMVIEAKKHSQEMANHKIPFGHQNFMARINHLHKTIKNSGAAAENVAYNYKDAGDVVSNWLKSPGHKHNIDGNYDLTGIGVARDSKGKLYFTQLFLKTTGTTAKHSARRATGLSFASPFFSWHS